MKKILVTLLLTGVFSARITSAQWTFQANLSGLGENPPNGSPASGFGTVILNASQTQITVDESWSGLTAPATASHIHTPGGVGTNAPVVFPFSGVPATTAGAIPEQTFSITAAQVTQLFAGYSYMNVHTSTFPGGEIRGQLLLVPEPAPYALFALLAGLAVWMHRRRHQFAH